MASSSSRPYQTHTHLPTGDKAVQEEVEKEEDWLKLGLGLGLGLGNSSSSWNKIVGQNHKSNPILASPSQTLNSYPQIELGLGFEDKSSSLEAIRKGKEEMEHSLLMGWPSDNCYDDHHDNDNDNGMVLWPSSSSSSCQIIMNPRGEDLPLQIPTDSHHYWGRSNHLNHNQSGLWFTLRSFTNRSGEVLPQISKEYIRVKDENMTVLMVKKYLVTKLGLSNEAEIDISCMGESLLHIQTLKQVRDTIWLPRLVESVNSTTLSLGDFHDITMNHLMSLNYQKHCIFN